MKKNILSQKVKEDIIINNAEDTVKLFRKAVLDNNREHFIALTLSTRNKPIGIHIISIGTLNASLVHPREVFTEAIKERAVNMIVAHNHPSGDTSPSDADIELTDRLKNAGRILGINVIDHIIITNKSFRIV